MAEDVTRESLERELAELDRQVEGIADGSPQADAIALGVQHAVEHLRKHFFGCWIRLGDGRKP